MDPSASPLQSSVMADDNTVTEEREELMVSPVSGEVHLRKAHFLKPPITSVDAPVAAPSLDRSAAATSCKDLLFTVSYGVWGLPSSDWRKWVDRMRSSHHSSWERAGILDAITSSTYSIHRSETLILGLVEKWSPTTNSFVFPWGEATITLEDMMALGAYSVLGDSVLTPPEDEEMEEKVAELLGARVELHNSTAKKACLRGWMAKFMDSAAGIEHEAFLAYWLSKFVFPIYSNAIGTSVLPIAVRLARGTRIALAPAVLASIYRSLTLLKDAVSKPARKRVVVSAPLSLVQVWAWERFPALRSNPRRHIEENEPRIARWDGFTKGRGAPASLDFGREDGFRWRPYASGACMDDGRWETVEPGLNQGMESFVRCVRVSKLVGLEEEKCVEQYLPHRVAMQFGMDQDLPVHVARDKSVDPEIAWKDYIRPVREAKIYVPSRLSRPRVTSRYLQWWKKLNALTDDKDSQSRAAPKRKRKRKRKRVEEDSTGEAAVSEQLQYRVDARRHCATTENAKRSGFGGKGCYKRTKRSYLQSFRRQRSADFEPLRRHSGAAAKSSETKSPETLEDDDSDYLCSAPISNPMKASEATETSGCETDGSDQDQQENCLFSAPGNEKVGQVMPSVGTEAKSMQTEEVSEAMMDRGAGNFGTNPSRALSLGGREERVRILEEICRMLEAGKLARFPKGLSKNTERNEIVFRKWKNGC